MTNSRRPESPWIGTGARPDGKPRPRSDEEVTRRRGPPPPPRVGEMIPESIRKHIRPRPFDRDDLEAVCYIRIAEARPTLSEDDVEREARALAQCVWERRWDLGNPAEPEALLAAYRRWFEPERAALEKEFIARTLRKANVPEDYFEARIGDFSTDVAERAVQLVLEDSAGLLICGPYGTGKTHLAAAVVAELAKRFRTDSPDIAWGNVPALLVEIRGTYGRREGKTEQEIIRAASIADWLVLDDLGAENSTDWTWSTVYVLLNSRLENGRKTIVTTNETANAIDAGSGRIASRLKAFSRLALAGRDRRDREAGRKGLFHDGGLSDGP